MPRKTTPLSLSVLMSGLMLSACGGALEAGVAADEETLDTQESAMCSLMSVTGLTVDGMDSYGHVTAGAGTWTVSPNTNSVYMEIKFDNEPEPTRQKYIGTSYDAATGRTSGTWSYSKGDVSCGSHTVVIKAFPRHYSSNGDEEICSTPYTLTRTVYEDCGTPQLSSLFCSRYPDPYTASTVRCDAWATGGSGIYTYLWRTDGGSWVQGQYSNFLSCPYPSPGTYATVQRQYQVKVVDSAGRESGILTSPTYTCKLY